MRLLLLLSTLQILCLPGCNPEWPSEVLATWTDNCSAGGVLVGIPGEIITDECSQSRSYFFSVMDECGNLATASTIITRQFEETSPEITAIADFQLELCNATWPPFLTTTWFDGCAGGGIVEGLPGEISILNCLQTRPYTFNVTSECGNSAQAVVWVSRIFDETGPVFGPIEPFTVQCDLFDAIPTPSVTDNCSLIELSFTDEPVSEICNYSFVRTWIATDDCFNTTIAQQIINVVDTVGPVFSNIEPVITVACIEDVPVSTPTVYDECTGEILDYQVLIVDGGGNPDEICVVTTAFGPGADWALWLPSHFTNGFSSSANFVFDANGGTFDQFENGTAHLYGTVVNDVNPSESYILDFWFENKRDWTEWSALGRDYKDDAGFAAAGGDLWTTWSYYELVNNFSTATGTGDLAGNILYFQHMPASYVFGFQVGLAANNKNANYGMSGWFTYTGVINGVAVNGYGDVNVDADCIIQQNNECINGITYTINYLAIDDCFNATVFSQLIIVNDIVAPEFVDFPADITISCEEWPVLVPEVIAVDNCGGDVILEFFTQTTEGNCEGNFTITYTWVATDLCDNSSQATYTVTVVDSTPPTIITCPEGAHYVCIPNVPPADVSLVTAVDNCSDVTIVHVGDNVNGDECSGSIIRTYRAYDECGNYSDCIQIFTYSDTIAPVFDNIPANMFASCENVPAISDVTASDNCGADVEVIISVQETFFSGGCVGVIQRIYTATDACGNTATFEHYITLIDTLAPVLANLPANASYECDEAIPAPANVTATDNCDESVIVEFNETTVAGDCPQDYIIYRTWSAIDTCGNAVSYTQVINVSDTTPPTFDVESWESNVSCETPINFPAPIATDNCDDDVSVVLTTTTTQGDCPNEFTQVHTWVATDNCGNSSSETITINQVDSEAPVFTFVPPAITVECGSAIPVTTATATDNCGEVTITYADSQLSGDDCAGSIARTFTAVDECGNSATATQMINIIDTTAPVITACPADVNYDCLSDVLAPNTSLVIASDECSVVTITLFSEVTNGDDCSGTIVRTYRATDICGNYADCIQTITYDDTEAPIFITVPADLLLDCNDEIPGAEELEVTDNCGDVTIIWTDVHPQPQTGTETQECQFRTQTPGGWGSPANGNNPGAYRDANFAAAFPNGLVVGCNGGFTLTLTSASAVEAFLPSGGSPAVLTQNWVNPAGDLNNTFAGHISALALSLGFDSYDPNFGPSSDLLAGAVINSGTFSGMTVGAVFAIANDVFGGCSNAYTASQMTGVLSMINENFVDGTTNLGNTDCDFDPSLLFVCEYVITRTYTATDACGNSTSITQTITLTDTTPPTITCAEGGNYVCVAEIPAANIGSVVVSDDCNDVTVTLEFENVVGDDCSGTLVRIYRATDACGNYAECTQTFTYGDNIAPVFNMQNSEITVACDEVAQIPTPTATDNCGVVPTITVTSSITPGDCANEYSEVYVWTATDNCGNSSSVSFTVNYVDEIAPVFTFVPAAISVECGTTIPVTTAEAVDNCGDVTITYADSQLNDDECLGYYLRTFTAVDACGNSATATQIINIIDTTAPTFSITNSSVTVDCGTDYVVSTPVAFDNCDNNPTVTVVSSTTPGDCANEYSEVYVWTATDNCGNSSSVSLTVNYVDEIAPVFTSRSCCYLCRMWCYYPGNYC
jgi:large repetitive protein